MHWKLFYKITLQMIFVLKFIGSDFYNILQMILVKKCSAIVFTLKYFGNNFTMKYIANDNFMKCIGNDFIIKMH